MIRFGILLAVLALMLTGLVAVRARRHGASVMEEGRSAASRVEEIARGLWNHPETVAEPAPLSVHHGDLPELEDCRGCHSLTEHADEEGCLECHELMRDRLAAGAGYHGRLTGACVDCHTEHAETIVRLDHEAFNHALALYPLSGRHAELDCEACHETTTAAGRQRLGFVGIAHGLCTDCHQDPHAGELHDAETACESCHDERGWTGRALLFRHERDSDYRLLGQHADVACADCHEPPGPEAALGTATFRGLGSGCADCHRDPHAGELAETACEACHVETGWGGRHLTFDHETVASFPLTGAHRTVACAECHRAASPDAPLAEAPLRGLATDCAACHEDPHVGSLSERACTECHTTESWRGDALSFDHATMSAFQLDALHERLDCTACHADVVYRPAPAACADCHTLAADHLAGRIDVAGERVSAGASPHAGRVACAECHDPAEPTPSLADHATRCASCHTPRYADLYLERRALLAELVVAAQRATAALPPGPERERREAGIRAHAAVGSHDFVEAERGLRAVLEGLQK